MSKECCTWTSAFPVAHIPVKSPWKVVYYKTNICGIKVQATLNTSECHNSESIRQGQFFGCGNQIVDFISLHLKSPELYFRHVSSQIYELLREHRSINIHLAVVITVCTRRSALLYAQWSLQRGLQPRKPSSSLQVSKTSFGWLIIAMLVQTWSRLD